MAKRSHNVRPKSSQPRQMPIHETATLPHDLLLSQKNSIAEPSNLEEFVKHAEFPVKVQVCSGEYVTHNGQTFSCNKVLYLNQTIVREVVQISFKSPGSTGKRVVNLPLKGHRKIGFCFEQSSYEFKGVSQICSLRRNQKQPKVLYTMESCTCSAVHVKKFDILIITGIQKNEVTALHPYTSKTSKLPKQCDAKFTADPEYACTDLKDVRFLLHHSFPWEVMLHEDLSSGSSSPRNAFVRIECQFTEVCVEAQVSTDDGFKSEKYLIPVIACIRVAKLSCSRWPVLEQENVYEEIDGQVLEQPTEIDIPRKISESSSDSYLPHLISSNKSSLSSMSQATSSFSEVGKSGLPMRRKFSEREHEELTLKNVLWDTKDITRRTFQLGINLNIPKRFLDITEANYPHDIERRKAQIFSYWLENECNASWAKIVSALWDMDEFGAAEKIARMHSVDVPKREDPMTDVGELEEGTITEKKRKFKELGQDIEALREELCIIEHVCMFQEQKTVDQSLRLNGMRSAIADIEKGIKKFPCEIRDIHLRKQRQEEEDKAAAASSAKGASMNFQESHVYYNAFPMGKTYASKLWVSESDIIETELKEVEARIHTLENGIKKCKERRTELKTFTMSTAETNNECLLGECYSIRLLLDMVSYQYKLAKLRFKREQLNQKMKEIREEREAEKKQSVKQITHYEAKQGTTTMKDAKKPIPKPRFTSRSKSANRQYLQPCPHSSAYDTRKQENVPMIDYKDISGTKSPTNRRSIQQRDQSKHWAPTPKPRAKPPPANLTVPAGKPRLTRSRSQEKREELECFGTSGGVFGHLSNERALNPDSTPVPQRRLPIIAQHRPAAAPRVRSASRTYPPFGNPQTKPPPNSTQFLGNPPLPPFF